MNANTMAGIRYGLTLVIAGFTAAYTYYPHQLWIPIIIATLSPIGIHVVPSQAQFLLPRAGSGI